MIVISEIIQLTSTHGVKATSTMTERELFAGHNPNNPPTGRFAYDGPTLREPAPGEENDEDVEGIKQQTKFVKQEKVLILHAMPYVWLVRRRRLLETL